MMRYSTPFDRERGQVLIEAIVAISIAIVGILTSLTLLSRSLAINRTISDRNVATYLAVEAVEITKNLIDANILKSGCGWPGSVAGVYVIDFESFPSGLSCPITGLRSSASLTQRKVYKKSGGTYQNGPGGGASETGYERTVSITYPAGMQAAQVSSTVKWTGMGGVADEVAIVDRFYNWRP